MKQGAERFSFKTEDYAKYRPEFPMKIIDFLYDNNAINNTSVAADVGSGTGRFTRLLLKKSHLVYGVEQNNEMRTKAEELLSQFSKFISIAGSAENTGLPYKSLDLITVAQAFHWFHKEKCLMEFKRILKDKGKVFIVWDDFINDYNEFSKEYGNLLNEFRIVEKENKEKKITRTERIEGFFKDNNYISTSFTHEVYQGLDGVRGGALSASFTPKPGEKNYEDFIVELQKVFDKYQEDGKVCTAFKSACYLGEI